MPVSYNQSGYIGSSMSVRAASAYEDGEMPKSKWTKKVMLAAIEDWCIDNEMVLNKDISKMKKDELFQTYFYCSSWHHTSKYANETDFYSLDEERIATDCVKMPPSMVEAMEEVEARLKDAYTQAREAFKEKWCNVEELERKIQNRIRFEYLEEHGFSPTSAAAYVKTYPERVTTRVSSKGNTVYHVDGKDIVEKDLPKVSMYFFNAVLVEELDDEERGALEEYRRERACLPKWPSEEEIRAAKVAAIQGTI